MCLDLVQTLCIHRRLSESQPFYMSAFSRSLIFVFPAPLSVMRCVAWTVNQTLTCDLMALESRWRWTLYGRRRRRWRRRRRRRRRKMKKKKKTWWRRRIVFRPDTTFAVDWPVKPSIKIGVTMRPYSKTANPTDPPWGHHLYRYERSFAQEHPRLHPPNQTGGVKRYPPLWGTTMPPWQAWPCSIQSLPGPNNTVQFVAAILFTLGEFWPVEGSHFVITCYGIGENHTDAVHDLSLI